jgi:subtilisin family serine protease
VRYRSSDRRLIVIALAAAAALGVQSTSGQSPHAQAQPQERFNGRPAMSGQVIVKFRELPHPEELALAADPDRHEPVGGAGARLLHSRSFDTAALIERLSRRPDVEFVEPDYIVQADQIPDDPWFSALWGLLNSGQSIQNSTGTAGADIGAAAAWEISTGSRAVVVAVVDTGVDDGHSELAPNMWAAPASFTVTIGGRTITCAAGTHGFNAIRMSCDPRDDNNHGTHVAGTIGAAGNNGAGVTGVNWVASLMALKFLDATGSGSTSDAINAIEFAIQARSRLGAGANVRVLSNSWGGGAFSQALLDQINRANANDMLFVASAGNAGANNDDTPYFPASYAAPNVVSVAATDNNDRLAGFSNVGPTSVHLGAPGVDVLSTVRGNAFAYGSGTSMAVPHVAGAAVLALSACTLTTPALKGVLLDTVRPAASLTGLTVTGGRLDAGSALTTCASAPPSPDYVLALSPSALSVKRAKAATFTVTVTGQNGFSAPVALSVSGLPPDASAAFDPPSISGSGSSTLTVRTGRTSRGTFTLTITGATPDALVRTATVTLKVS